MKTWTPARIAAAQKLLAKYPSNKLDIACEALNVTVGSLRGAFQRAGLPEPRTFMAPKVKQVGAVKEGAPVWAATMPKGQRLRGNSTLLNGAGETERKWVKTERSSKAPPAYEVEPTGHTVKKVSSLLDGQGAVRAQWVSVEKDRGEEEFWAAAERHVKSYKGLAKPTKVAKTTDSSLCTVYPLGDPHIGMLSWYKETGADFDLKIAEADLYDAVDLLVDRAPAAARGVLVNLGDFVHADSTSELTKSGHKLDCDTRWGRILDIGFRLMRRMVDKLLVKHNVVDVISLPGNHDSHVSRMLAMWLKAVYENEPRVNILDNFNPIQYLRHGKNLWGFTHGDMTKPEQLPGIMASDEAAAWGDTDFRQWFCGHVHHISRKEFPGCVVETYRTMAPKDFWHHSKGYRAGQSLNAITFDSDFGETCRFTVDIKLVRHLQKKLG